MEIRSNNLLVGLITLLLFILVAVFLVWIVRFGEAQSRDYDIFFRQSVGGLTKGAGVSYSGVPVGQVKKVEIWPKDPALVRVRISVYDEVSVLDGTVATISSLSFTAPPHIQLHGAMKGAEQIVEIGPEGVPVIPTKPGPLGEILNSAPIVIERITLLLERMSGLLNDENIKNIAGLLENSNEISKALAAASPGLAASIAESHQTLQGTTRAANNLADLAESSNNLVKRDGVALTRDLRESLKLANISLKQLNGLIENANKGVENLSTKTLPATDQLVNDLQSLSTSLTLLTEKIEDEGALSVIASPQYPEYDNED